MKSIIYPTKKNLYISNKEIMLKVVVRRKRNKSSTSYIHYTRKVEEMKGEGIYYSNGSLYYFDGTSITKEYSYLSDTYADINRLIRIKKLEQITKTED